MSETNRRRQSTLRRGRFSQENARYFVTVCSKNRRQMLCEDEVPEIIFKSLTDMKDVFNLIALVVMPDHLHFIIKLKERTLAECIQMIKGVTAFKIIQCRNQKGSVWQRGYYDHKFRTDDDLGPILHYMWNNPNPPGTHFRCNKEDWIWFKSIVTEDINYPTWLSEHPMGV